MISLCKVLGRSRKKSSLSRSSFLSPCSVDKYLAHPSAMHGVLLLDGILCMREVYFSTLYVIMISVCVFLAGDMEDSLNLELLLFSREVSVFVYEAWQYVSISVQIDMTWNIT